LAVAGTAPSVAVLIPIAKRLAVIVLNPDIFIPQM
jgi:hypothetical protein